MSLLYRSVENVSKMVDAFSRLLLVVFMSTMIVVILIGISNRFVMHLSISWTEEVATYLLVYISLIGSGVAMREGGHIGITYLTSKMGKSKTYVNLLGTLSIIVFLFCLMVYGYILSTSQSFQTSPALRISMTIPFMAIPIGSGIMLVHSVALFFKLLNQIFGITAEFRRES